MILNGEMSKQTSTKKHTPDQRREGISGCISRHTLQHEPKKEDIDS